ncbi:Two-component signal transduction system YycFG, regulatory protein YycI [Lentibacillus persicus]|uniref:Two-component signal transduction system YycFG, regulatory protein YycI n=1 Tax=Lentibacillus persicus TaxID=640948 RepID=A0A1I1UR81_9BACI|nr:two-component system regulatory protein YycI [Lentibacillus persicus]SFD70490.1 Two-component signal transduction system YycFG, regulatory protein YycI [Lentibacillus persicus]
MQWKQIKTLFILCFLVLNVYLLLMLYDKQTQSEYALPDTSDSTFDQKLESENISISATLPNGDFNVPYLSLDRKSFTEEELAFFEEADNQEAEVINENFILSHFENPISIPEDADSSLVSDLVKSNILLADNYRFSSWNKDMNVLIFFQEKNELPIYYNQSGIVLVYLNEENEMIFYTQTMLGDDESPEEESLIEPMEAIRTLFNENRLQNGDEITEVNMGYHTRIPLETGEQGFSPTWTVTVNDEENFYVNAIENQVGSNDELDFLKESVDSTIERVQKLEESDLTEFLLSHLNQKLSSNQQSE